MTGTNQVLIVTVEFISKILLTNLFFSATHSLTLCHALLLITRLLDHET